MRFMQIIKDRDDHLKQENFQTISAICASKTGIASR